MITKEYINIYIVKTNSKNYFYGYENRNNVEYMKNWKLMSLNLLHSKLVVIFDEIVQNFKIIFWILVIRLMRNFYKKLKRVKGNEE